MELRPTFAHASGGAGIASSFKPHQAGGGCCGMAGAQLPVEAPLRRAKLADLDGNFHCSIIGTCLSTGELRRLIPRYAPELDRERASDLAIHHAAVELCQGASVVAKEVNKALDTRHALAIKQFKAAADERQLRQLWSGALASGHVPGAYWALMTHPLASRELRVLAFGDVHMLSHLVGASNRADIRRLATLEAERKAMLEHEQQQQARIHDLQAQLAQHAALAAGQEQRIAHLARVCEQQREEKEEQERPDLTARIEHLMQQLSLQGALRDRAERLLGEQERAHQDTSAALEGARAEATANTAELRAMEQTLLRALQGAGSGGPLRRLDGQRIAYVGGRPGTVSQLRQLVAAAGGELLAHDGGVEERKASLAALLARADLIVFPVDCISHGAMHAIKRFSLQQGVPYSPLRCASVASFVALIEERAPALL